MSGGVLMAGESVGNSRHIVPQFYRALADKTRNRAFKFPVVEAEQTKLAIMWMGVNSLGQTDRRSVKFDGYPTSPGRPQH